MKTRTEVAEKMRVFSLDQSFLFLFRLLYHSELC